MQRDSRALLWDASRAAERIAAFTLGMSFQTYCESELTRSAVERQLEILGEALKRLRDKDISTAGKVPDLHRIIGMRNVLVHGYATVDDEVVWRAATERVPELRPTFQNLLGDPDSDGSAEPSYAPRPGD